MTRVSVSTFLAASPDTVWTHVQTPRLLHYVSRGVMSFKSKELGGFPDIWPAGEHLVSLKWKGVLPIGTQVIGIEYPSPRGDVRLLRDNGRSALIRKWDHMIEIRPEGDGTYYTDTLDLEAGLLTGPVALFAKRFYAHRQKRWRQLVANTFDYET